jgi:hypothetical protein
MDNDRDNYDYDGAADDTNDDSDGDDNTNDDGDSHDGINEIQSSIDLHNFPWMIRFDLQ